MTDITAALERLRAAEGQCAVERLIWAAAKDAAAGDVRIAAASKRLQAQVRRTGDALALEILAAVGAAMGRVL